MSPSTVQIRRAGAADLDATRALIAIRGSTDEGGTDTARGPDLDNPRRALWLAFDGTRAVGMTSVQLRTLVAAGREMPVAYWTGLFVDPAYGSNFIYPQLLLGMFKGLRELGIGHMYAAVRRRQVAESHMKVGFQRIGELPVLAKPLRPARLLLRYRRWDGPGWLAAGLRALCLLPDTLFAAIVRLQGPRTPTVSLDADWSAAACAELAQLISDSGESTARQRWPAELLAFRYGNPAAGYRRVLARRDGRLVAALVLRVVERAGYIRAAVILDVLSAADAADGIPALLAAAERAALEADCDLLLWLDGADATLTQQLRRRGFLRTAENYTLLGRCERGAASDFLPTGLTGWRFAFGDHDTF